MELNRGDCFPGLSVEHWNEKKISTLADKNAVTGKLTKETQFLVIEFRDPETGGFNFKWSSNEKDQMKCDLFSCGKSGFFSGF